MQVAMLGPLRLVQGDGAVVGLGGTRLRMLLARLALDAGKVVSVAELVDSLWGDEPPADATNALQSLVSRLRRGLRDGADGLIESHPAGYRLAVAAEQVDVHRFERLVAQGRVALADGRYAEACATLREAERLWAGAALAGLEDAPFVPNVVARLGELRLAAVEDRVEAEIKAGRHGDVVAELATLVAEQPLRERAVALLMEALFLSGRQADALAVYDQARRVLLEELGVEPSATLRELQVAVLRGDLAPARVKPVVAALTSFVGRQAELAEVTRLLDATRLVTLLGPGGAGKTRLSREVVAGQDGVTWFVELAGVRVDEDVPAAVLATLGIRETRLLDGHTGTPRAATALERLVDALGGQRCLLVLDNCEHLIISAATLADSLLARCPRLRVLATSREPLAITGETAYPLGPLGLPTVDTSPERVIAADAVRLFADRAESAAPGFRVDGSNAAVVAEICRRLDGLPLALELAAARLRSMTVGQIAERLDDRFRLLTGGSRTSLPRHRTLRAVVEWSWDLLEKPERLLAARLSVFPVAALAESVAAVAQDTADDADDVVYLLASLVEKSIVVAAEGKDGQVRYRMLETVRAYAAERLTELGETERVRRAYCHHFLAYLTEAEPRLRGPDQVRWLARVTADHENLLAALRHAVDLGDADVAHRLAVAAGWFWMISGHHREALKTIAEVATVPGDAPPHARAAVRSMAVFVKAGGMPDPDLIREVRAELAATDAMAHYPIMAMMEPMLAAFSGDIDEAIAGLERGRSHPDEWARALTLLASAFLHDNQGLMAEAEVDGERALTAFRELGDRWGQAIAIGQVSERRSLRGDHVGAVAANEESVRLVAELGAVDEMPGVLGRLGLQRARAGDLVGAEADLRRAMDLASSSTQESQALLLGWLAALVRLRGDLDEAKVLLGRGRALLEVNESRTPHWYAMFSSVAAQIALAEGDPEAALAHLAESLKVIVPVGDMPHIGSVAEVVACTLLARADPIGSARVLAMAEVIRGAPDLGNPEVVELRANLDAALGVDGAASAYASGMALDREAALAELHRVLGLEPLPR